MIDRDYYIDYLVQFNPKRAKEYYDKLTDRELIVEYQDLIKLD
jgi:hypothetical protein